MPSRSQYNRRGSDGDEDEIVAVSSDSEESESEANRGAEADDDEYVGESSDAGGGDEAEEAGSSDCGEGGDVDGDDHDGHGRRPLRGLRRGAAAPDKERKSQNVDALVRYALTPSHQPLD
jgi:DNA repair and recombination RAD54-like protein